MTENNILVFPETSGFRRYEDFFTGESVQHPAKANLQMLKWIIERYSEVGDLILDPMAGTFSTAIIAGLLGRDAVGVEYEEKFYQMGIVNKERFDRTPLLTAKGSVTVLKGDARRLSSILEGKEPQVEDNGENKSYLSEMKRVYGECFHVLKDGGLMVLIVKNFVRGGKQIRLDLDTISLCESAGFRLKERWRRKLTNLSFWQVNHMQKYLKKIGVEVEGNPIEFIWRWNRDNPEKAWPGALWEAILVFEKPVTGDLKSGGQLGDSGFL